MINASAPHLIVNLNMQAWRKIYYPWWDLIIIIWGAWVQAEIQLIHRGLDTEYTKFIYLSWSGWGWKRIQAQGRLMECSVPPFSFINMNIQCKLDCEHPMHMCIYEHHWYAHRFTSSRTSYAQIADLIQIRHQHPLWANVEGGNSVHTWLSGPFQCFNLRRLLKSLSKGSLRCLLRFGTIQILGHLFSQTFLALHSLSIAKSQTRPNLSFSGPKCVSQQSTEHTEYDYTCLF